LPFVIFLTFIFDHVPNVVIIVTHNKFIFLGREASTIKLIVDKLSKRYKQSDILEYINKQVLKTNLNLLVYDWPILNVSEDATIRDDFNGNIRLVFERY